MNLRLIPSYYSENRNETRTQSSLALFNIHLQYKSPKLFYLTYNVINGEQKNASIDRDLLATIRDRFPITQIGVDCSSAIAP